MVIVFFFRNPFLLLLWDIPLLTSLGQLAIFLLNSIVVYPQTFMVPTIPSYSLMHFSNLFTFVHHCWNCIHIDAILTKECLKQFFMFFSRLQFCATENSPYMSKLCNIRCTICILLHWQPLYQVRSACLFFRGRFGSRSMSAVSLAVDLVGAL